ncbi:hypothetical protein G3N95_31500 [Paraburkholderia sp. Tr-20389]|uniref:hypothetical protein n=1 Tax=Paraburkholderia sp. Tr-20389 TaxID=2703903 RepID=UPI0019801C81|nr:hypothetical protein [Paraburkholderia sp. Tr-20389]MBN3757490.1 hypothetical protein [Paraburkholderia sp. Tr-20389]
MNNEPVRLATPPKPTLVDPYAQIKWMFFQLEAEFEGSSAYRFHYALNKYLEFVAETNANYPDLLTNKRFYLSKHWEADALFRFTKWLTGQTLSSRTRYAIYKSVRQVMDMAYALRVIDTGIHHPLVFKGVSETKQRSAYAMPEQEVINASVARWISLGHSVLCGYIPTNLGFPYRRRYRSTISVDNQLFTLTEAANRFGISQKNLSARIHDGWASRQAVGLDPPPPPKTKTEIIVEGVYYPSMSAAAAAYGSTISVVAQKIRRGYSPEQSVGIEPIHVLKGDDLGLLWMFENEYGCNASAMYDDFCSKRSLAQECPRERLLKLFMRWGVWPFIDDRLIMPLALELSILTGLNVESLRKLNVDSYQAEHPLTGQSAITHHKRRSGSPTRPEERVLHVPLLDDPEDLNLDEHVAKKVEALWGMIVALTAKIRRNAPAEIANRLFIFEDVEASKREKRQVIVGIEPKGKARVWNRRFVREEGLLRHFGDDFSFNLARCRPTLATNKVLEGASLFRVQAVLGHKSIQTTATYLDEQNLRPAFNRTVSEALERIAQRSRDAREMEQSTLSVGRPQTITPTAFHETLSGCGCCDPYNPSEDVRAITLHVEGSVCKFWNMCLRCDSAIVTEHSLPKLILYRNRVAAALMEDSPAIRSRKDLYRDAVTLIDGLLADDVIFPAHVVENARTLAIAMDDILVDHLIYQGI